MALPARPTIAAMTAILGLRRIHFFAASDDSSVPGQDRLML